MFYDRVSVHASVGMDPISDEDEPGGGGSLHVRMAAVVLALSSGTHVKLANVCGDYTHVTLS